MRNGIYLASLAFVSFAVFAGGSAQACSLPAATVQAVQSKLATVVNLPEGAKGTTTVESKTNFVGGAREGTTVIATATPIHRGRRTQVWQTRLETEDGKLVALVTQTQLVL